MNIKFISLNWIAKAKILVINANYQKLASRKCIRGESCLSETKTTKRQGLTYKLKLSRIA